MDYGSFSFIKAGKKERKKRNERKTRQSAKKISSETIIKFAFPTTFHSHFNSTLDGNNRHKRREDGGADAQNGTISQSKERISFKQTKVEGRREDRKVEGRLGRASWGTTATL